MIQTLIVAPLFVLILLSCFIASSDKASAASSQKADLRNWKRMSGTQF